MPDQEKGSWVGVLMLSFVIAIDIIVFLAIRIVHVIIFSANFKEILHPNCLFYCRRSIYHQC